MAEKWIRATRPRKSRMDKRVGDIKADEKAMSVIRNLAAQGCNNAEIARAIGRSEAEIFHVLGERK